MSADKPSPGMAQLAVAYVKDPALRLEVLCGITVALAQVPEAVAFALVAGVKPAVGLTAAWIVCLITALAGGRPAMISGATCALAVVVGNLVKDEGIEYLFIAVVMMGVIQLLCALLQAGRLVKLIPVPVMIGFCNGLACVIGLAQFTTYKAPDGRRLGGGSFGVFTDGEDWITGTEALFAAIITVVAFAICNLLPLLTKKVPAALTAIVVCTVLEWAVVRAAFDEKTRVVKDIASVGGSFPVPVWFNDDYTMPTLDGEVFMKCLPLSVILACIGLLESMMTLNLIDEITQTKGCTRRECFGQGIANVVCGILGGMGGCAMIGQSMINISSGARRRESSTIAGAFLAVCVFVAYPVIDLIPVSSLAGVMFHVVVATFEWESLKMTAIALLPQGAKQSLFSEEDAKKTIRKADVLAIWLVTVVTLFFDLAVAVFTGVIFSALMFAWESSALVSVTTHEEPSPNDEKVPLKVYELHGSIYFGSTKDFLGLFDVDNDPAKVRLDLRESAICDYSAVEALRTLGKRYENLNKEIVVRTLGDTVSERMITKSNGEVCMEVQVKVVQEDVKPEAPHRLHVADVQTPAPSVHSHTDSGDHQPAVSDSSQKESTRTSEKAPAPSADTVTI